MYLIIVVIMIMIIIIIVIVTMIIIMIIHVVIIIIKIKIMIIITIIMIIKHCLFLFFLNDIKTCSRFNMFYTYTIYYYVWLYLLEFVIYTCT